MKTRYISHHFQENDNGYLATITMPNNKSYDIYAEIDRSHNGPGINYLVMLADSDDPEPFISGKSQNKELLLNSRCKAPRVLQEIMYRFESSFYFIK